MIWHIYSGQCCFKGILGMDLLSSGDVAFMMVQVPCDFRPDRWTFIFQPVAPDVIWHIYSHLYGSSRDGARDLPSSGEAAPTMGQVPCEFQADWPGCSFLREELRQGSFQPCPTQDGASSMAGGSRCDLAHLVWAMLLNGGWCHPLAIFRGGAPCSGEGPLQVPCWVQDLLKMADPYLQPCPQLMCQITSGAAGWKMKVGQSPQNSKRTCPIMRASSHEDSRSMSKPPWSSAAQSKCAKSHQEPPAEKWRLANLLEIHRGPAPW